MPALPIHPHPTPPPNFDVFEVLPSEVAVLDTYTDVYVISDVGTHFSPGATDPNTFFVVSGGAGIVFDPLVGPVTSTPNVAHVKFAVPVAETFTIDTVLTIGALPNDFTNIPGQFVILGGVDQNGCCAALFFSKVGIAYTGSVVFDDLNFTLALNSPVQLLPDSVGLVLEGVSYAIRVAVDSNAGAAFIYVTEAAMMPVIGHQLKFIMPALPTGNSLLNPGDEVIFGCKGTDAHPAFMAVQRIALSSSLVIPNLPPVADPGRDQAIRSCSIARFDGRASFDPEGAQVQYNWRLIDGPDSSSFVWTGYDGSTAGPVQTDTFYSAELGALTGAAAPEAGDTLLCGGVPYTIIGTGSPPSFFVQIDGNDLPPGLLNVSFKLLKGNALSNRTEAQPSFYPDVSGLFRFDLVVFDGDLYSLPAVMLVNVTDSPVPRGITPDVTFLWDYISDFWRLVENTEIIETFWSSLAQIAASELLTLWQHDYGKSLRDIQRTFQRKWLHYDPFMRDPFPDATIVSHIFGGVITLARPATGIPLASVPRGLVLTSPMFGDVSLFLSPSGPVLLPSEMKNQLERQLLGADKRFQVDLLYNVLGDTFRIMIRAPFAFSILNLESSPLSNDLPSGDAGAPIGVNTYVVDRRVDNIGVVENDFLVVDGTAYRILHVVTDPSDQWAGQRLVLKDNLPITAGKVWTIARGCSSKFMDFYRSLCSAGDSAVIEIENTASSSVSFVTVDVLSAAEIGNSRLLINTNPLAEFLCQPAIYAIFLYAVYRRTYLPVEPLVAGVPLLQELIKNADDSAVLRQNIDYYLETFRGQSCLRFLTRANGSVDVWQDELPPQQMWAEISYIDNRPTIEGNFGLPAQFTLDDLAKLPSTVDYLSVVQGLWYLYFTGPSLRNIRAGTQILLGLPFAEVTGVIAEIRNDFSSSTGRILVTDATEAAIVRSYTFPAVLPLEINPETGKIYVVGDTVKQFAPLVTGVEVIDYVKNPKWFEGFVHQGTFFEIEKFFKFLVRVDSAAFSLNTLVFVKSFINRIKPTYTYPLYVVLKSLPATTIDITDDLVFHGRLAFNDWLGSFSYGSHYGMVGGAFDDPHEAFGGTRQAFDSDAYVYGDQAISPPTHPVAAAPIHWGYDRELLTPMDVIVGTLSATYGAPFTVTYDGLFQMDMPAFDALFGIFSGTYLQIPTSASPITLGTPQTVGSIGDLNEGIFIFRGTYPLKVPVSVVVQILVNDAVVENIPLTISATYDDMYPIPLTSFSLAPGDVVKVLLWSTGSDVPIEGGAKFFVALGHGSVWAFDTPLSAGTYYSPRLM